MTEEEEDFLVHLRCLALGALGMTAPIVDDALTDDERLGIYRRALERIDAEIMDYRHKNGSRRAAQKGVE